MRIVGGRFRGRSLSAPRSGAIRPTADRTRESLFNVLRHNYPDAIGETRVLDLFAGTGAVGLEALSLGASFVLFVEKSAEGRGLLRTNIEALGVQGQTKLFRRDAARLGTMPAMAPFGFVFADPPYGKGLGERALDAAAAGGWLEQGALAVLEDRTGAVEAVDGYFRELERRTFGDTEMIFLRYENNGEATGGADSNKKFLER